MGEDGARASVVALVRVWVVNKQRSSNVIPQVDAMAKGSTDECREPLCDVGAEEREGEGSCRIEFENDGGSRCEVTAALEQGIK